MKHLFLIILASCFISLGIFLPYFPGDYDYFATGLSTIIQFAVFASLFLVPIGLLWSSIEIAKSKRIVDSLKLHNYFRKSILAVFVVIILAAALGAFASKSRFVSVIILALGGYIFFKIREKGKELKPVDSGNKSLTPYYFIFIPLIVLFIRMTFLERVKNISTNIAIKQSEQLMQDIEAYRTANGHYPISLQSTIEDYRPRISGIECFHYEPNGEAYNLYFEQFSHIPGTQEIVMYNKLGEHEMTVHNQDLLRVSPESIRRGYHAVVGLSNPQWKVFFFD